MTSNEYNIPTVEVKGKRQNNPYSLLASAIIKKAIVDKDKYFFTTKWGATIITIAGCEGKKEKFIKMCEDGKCL